MPIHKITVQPSFGLDSQSLEDYLKQSALLQKEQYFRINKRSIDARKKQVKVHLEVEIRDAPIDIEFVEYQNEKQNVENGEPVVIVGAGPAGLFAALRAIELGFKPIVIERGKDVQSRRRDLAAINKEHKVNPDSNYCFGEGGAGTYSDGKLYTRSKKRGSIRRIFEILVAHGANEQILFESHLCFHPFL